MKNVENKISNIDKKIKVKIKGDQATVTLPTAAGRGRAAHRPPAPRSERCRQSPAADLPRPGQRAAAAQPTAAGRGRALIRL